MTSESKTSFKEWLASDDILLVAEGYVMEFVRRGYVAGGENVPEVVLENPTQLELLHEEFVHAGTDVVLGYTYNGNRKRMKTRGLENVVEESNRKANNIAKAVAKRHGKILAGGISNSSVRRVGDEAEKEIRELFEEQVDCAVEAGVEYIIAETLFSFLEAKVAIEMCKERNLPIVVCFHLYERDPKTLEGINVIDACKMAEDAGADVVGVNCGRSPTMTIPFLRELREKCKGPVAGIPSCYSTTEESPSWMDLTDPRTGEPLYPKQTQAMPIYVSEVEEFGRACQEIGVRYIGLCCGNFGYLTRKLAESLGRQPPACRYSGSEKRYKSFVPA